MTPATVQQNRKYPEKRKSFAFFVPRGRPSAQHLYAAAAHYVIQVPPTSPAISCVLAAALETSSGQPSRPGPRQSQHPRPSRACFECGDTRCIVRDCPSLRRGAPPKTSQLKQKLNLVNGVIFTGGRVKDGLYFEVVKGIFQKVLEKNDAGEHFPLLAICLGFELLTMIISKDNNILEEFSAANQASTVQFVENVKLERTVFGRFPSVLIKKMSTDCLVMQNHHFGISPERLQANKDLCSFFRILTTSTDKKNKVYVSTAQARRYPVTALQWHPEKNVFEWRSSQIPHTEDAIQVTQHVANYFVSEARKSSNKPAPSKLLDNLIYNYSPSFAGKAGGSFDEVYLFSPRPTLSSL
ncbi:PREDICTED: gamma-glutamyl hydrolase 2-like [Nicotiana attenuata]|uniref:gamma-glutamyl hydrolase 2-like n=1 Tax=Nicotiana attenuata TaxID=49451 RepID=UPI0009055CD5|nr:PREDICTED: gamma-glutamyl hydrolase 2-like [Nicotiana attenuata]